MNSFNKHALSSRAERIAKSNPSIPKLSSPLRPGADDYKQHQSAQSKPLSNETAKTNTERYSGNQLLGISTMHKSNAIPVTKTSNMAIETAKMRRG